ncbi:hypothetical protein HY994_01310 [Candidatus Micrarchaeota archaeon]|nr:hypothetical protein [Candidatus Micrarchaeota archaeon]
MSLYPFLPGAKASLTEGLNDSDVQDAVVYLKQSVADGADADGLWANDGRHVKMYALAKALLSCCGEHVKRKYALTKAQEYVQRANLSGDVLELGRAFFPSLASVETSNSVFLSVADYLSVGQHLSQMDVSEGKVRVPPQELNVLLSARIVAKFMETKVQDVPDFIRNAAKSMDELPPAPKSFGLKFLELGCIRHVRQGVGEGKRFYGAMGLAIAAQRDGLQKEQAQPVMDAYVNACSGTKPFAPSEGKSVVDWVFGRQIGFSCKKMMDDGFEGEYCKGCPLNWKKRAEKK